MFPCSFFFFYNFKIFEERKYFFSLGGPPVSGFLHSSSKTAGIICHVSVFFTRCVQVFYQLPRSVNGLDEFQSTALDQFWEPLPSSQCTAIPPLFLKPVFLFFETPSYTWPRKHLRWGSERQTELGRAPPRFRGCGAVEGREAAGSPSPLALPDTGGGAGAAPSASRSVIPPLSTWLSGSNH